MKTKIEVKVPSNASEDGCTGRGSGSKHRFQIVLQVLSRAVRKMNADMSESPGRLKPSTTKGPFTNIKTEPSPVITFFGKSDFYIIISDNLMDTVFAVSITVTQNLCVLHTESASVPPVMNATMSQITQKRNTSVAKTLKLRNFSISPQ